MESNAQTTALPGIPRLSLIVAQHMGLVDDDVVAISEGEDQWEALVACEKVSEKQLIELANRCRDLQRFAVKLRQKHFSQSLSSEHTMSLDAVPQLDVSPPRMAPQSLQSPEYYRQGRFAQFCERIVQGFGVYEVLVLLGTIAIIAVVCAIGYVLLNQFPSELMQKQFGVRDQSNFSSVDNAGLAKMEYEKRAHPV